MKTVTIEYYDGAKQKIKVPARAKYIEITPAHGYIFWYSRKPKIDMWNVVYDIGSGHDLHVKCLPDHEPAVDGIGQSILLKIGEV